MLRYLAQRLAQAAVIVAIVGAITFALIHLAPGDPFSAVMDNPNVSETVRQTLRAQYGLDRPLLAQYWDFSSHALRGDLGVGLRSQRPVLDSILEVLPGTVQLTLAALTLAAIFGISLGIVAAVAHGTWLDTAVHAADSCVAGTMSHEAPAFSELQLVEIHDR